MGESPAETAFLDRLYAAVFEPARWVDALESLADLTHGGMAFISRWNLVDGSGPAITARIDPEWSQRYNEHYSGHNPYATAADPRAFLRGWAPKVVTGDSWLSRDELRRNMYYNEFMVPQDVHALMFARLAAHDLDICAITVCRPETRGAFAGADLELTERLHPHMLRAYRMADRVAAMGGLTAGLEIAAEVSPHALVLLDEQGAVVRLNRPAERLLRRGAPLKLAYGRLAATRPGDERVLQALIARATGRGARSGGGLSLPQADGGLPLSLTVTPTAADPASVFARPRGALVAIHDPDAEVELDAERLRGLFGFTGAESRLAGELVRGASVRDAAATLSLSVHTVRHQLQAMLEKTGASRQAELVILLLRAAAAPSFL